MRLMIGKYRWMLLAIIAIAFYLRVSSIAFGLPGLNDPDEMMFELGAIRMLRGPTLDPGWFGHPATTTMYVLALVNIGVLAFALLTGVASSAGKFVELIYVDPSWMILPGRIAMMLFALGTIWMSWRLASRFFGPSAGLVAALLIAVDPVHIAWSQVIRSDIMACFFMLLCLQACCDIAENGRWRSYLRAAFWLGVAIATKWPFALTAIAIAGATLLAVRTNVLPVRTAITRLAASGAAAIGFLLLVSPYLLLNYSTVVRNLRGESQPHHLGATGGDFLHNFWWYLSGPIATGLGIVGLVLLLLGVVRLPRHRLPLFILAPLGLAFVLLFCGQQLVWDRWALPVLLIGAILAGGGWVVLQAILHRTLPAPAARTAVTLAVALAAVLPLGLRAWTDGVERTHDTRQQASAWARQHIPRDATILIEHFAYDLVSAPQHFLFPLADAGCVDPRGLVRGTIPYSVIDRARGSRSNLDYGTLPPDKAALCIPDFAILTQYDRYRAERTTFPNEYATYQRLIARGRIVATFAPSPGRHGGPIVRIVELRKP